LILAGEESLEDHEAAGYVTSELQLMIVKAGERNGPPPTTRSYLFIYLFIYYMVNTHVKPFTIVKNRKYGQVTSHCRKARPYRADLSLFLNVPAVTVKSEITV